MTNTITIYAQQQMPSSSTNTPPHIPSQSPPSTAFPKAVKIMSPIKGQQIPVGKDLTISGTSIDNATSNCQVSMSINHVRPYQPANAAWQEKELTTTQSGTLYSPLIILQSSQDQITELLQSILVQTTPPCYHRLILV
ncbi:MAG: hypothetical protein WA421_07100 [Nitrososphaeraceae archaeon]